MSKPPIILMVMFCFSASSVIAQDGAQSLVETAPYQRTWTVDGVERQAIMALPATANTNPAPVVFLFHGHGGRMEQAFKMYSMKQHWPEAIVVCPQGLNTPGMLTDPEGKRAGWQSLPQQQEDRDIRFFDEILVTLKQEFKVDEQRIYASGHSNGAAFTYLLWATRGDVFAAVAPCAGVIRPEMLTLLKPKPAMILAGEQDQLVKFQWQTASIEFIRKLNKCQDKPTREGLIESYQSALDAPLDAYIYPGGHRFPVEAVPSIVKFFKTQQKQVAPKGAEEATSSSR